MNYEKFYIADENGKSNCVVRSLCKILNKKYNEIYIDLCNVAKKLNVTSFNDIEVFENYMSENKIEKIKYGRNIKVKDLDLDDNSYIVFCWDKKDFYHMICIINNILYDKNNESLELYTISLYKKI